MPNQTDEIIHVNPPTTDRRTYRLFIYVGFIGIVASVIITCIQLMFLPQYLEALMAEDSDVFFRISTQLGQTYALSFEITLFIALGFFGYLSKNGSRLGIVFVLLSIEPTLLIIYQFIDSPYLSFIFETPDMINLMNYIVLTITWLIRIYILLKTRQTSSNKYLLFSVVILLVVSRIFPNVWYYLVEGFQATAVLTLDSYYEITIRYFPNILLYFPGPLLQILFVLTVALLFINELREDE